MAPNSQRIRGKSMSAAAIDLEAVAKALRKLRNDLAITQVQLANAIGTTPTSIHRYEAQASAPDLAMLVAFWDFALRNGSLATTDFAEIIAYNFEPLRPLLEAASLSEERLI